MLAAEQIQHYHDKGYVIPDYRLSEETLEDIKATHNRLLDRHPEFQDYCPNLLQYDLGFLNFIRDPIILNMVEQVIGQDFALWNSSFFAKPAQIGKRTPWHQDGEYWPIRPLATCTVWVAIDDATTENGCLRLLPGSHKDRQLKIHDTNPSDDVTLNQELRADQYDESGAVDLVLEAGQMSLHDIFMLHGSEANRSAHPRRGMTMRFMPTTSVFDRDLAKEIVERTGSVDHAYRTLFLMRGGDPSGQNDFAMRL